MNKIFEAGNMNERGICRGWSCDWIKRGKSGQVIGSRYDLSSGHQVGNLWDAAPDNDGIDTNFALVTLARVRSTSTPISPTWIATELTKGTGYYLFAVRGRTLNARTGSYDESGHAMATRKGMGKLQFFDPNEGLLEFDNTLEFYDYLPTYIRTTYPDLLSKEAEVKKF
jgi:hypothetical protein